MNRIAVVGVMVPTLLLALSLPSFAKSTKYEAEAIAASKTCRNDDAANPVSKCIKAFAEKFCKDKGHKSYVAANWATTKDGYSNPNLIYCK